MANGTNVIVKRKTHVSLMHYNKTCILEKFYQASISNLICSSLYTYCAVCWMKINYFYLVKLLIIRRTYIAGYIMNQKGLEWCK